MHSSRFLQHNLETRTIETVLKIPSRHYRSYISRAKNRKLQRKSRHVVRRSQSQIHLQMCVGVQYRLEWESQDRDLARATELNCSKYPPKSTPPVQGGRKSQIKYCIAWRQRASRETSIATKLISFSRSVRMVSRGERQDHLVCSTSG